MLFQLLEPTSSEYILLHPETNRVHLQVPAAVDATKSTALTSDSSVFFQPIHLKLLNALLAYKTALESDLSIIIQDEALFAKKSERLAQIKQYLLIIQQNDNSNKLAGIELNSMQTETTPLEQTMTEWDFIEQPAIPEENILSRNGFNVAYLRNLIPDSEALMFFLIEHSLDSKAIIAFIMVLGDEYVKNIFKNGPVNFEFTLDLLSPEDKIKCVAFLGEVAGEVIGNAYAFAQILETLSTPENRITLIHTLESKNLSVLIKGWMDFPSVLNVLKTPEEQVALINTLETEVLAQNIERQLTPVIRALAPEATQLLIKKLGPKHLAAMLPSSGEIYAVLNGISTPNNQILLINTMTTEVLFSTIHKNNLLGHILGALKSPEAKTILMQKLDIHLVEMLTQRPGLLGSALQGLSGACEAKIKLMEKMDVHLEAMFKQAHQLRWVLNELPTPTAKISLINRLTLNYIVSLIQTDEEQEMILNEAPEEIRDELKQSLADCNRQLSCYH